MDYWTAHYAAELASGQQTYEADDPNFNLDAILASLDKPDDWEDQPHLSTPPP